ncbi:hypothetical protein MMC30_006017 [Trapelia coarctata]|nr:hypothetical protein [Trapelia coarctata]
MAFLTFLICLSQFLIFPVFVSAQASQASTTSVTSPSAVVSATASSTSAAPTVVPSTALYTYMGCYNETTGYDQVGNVRALNDGNKTANDGMTVSYCLTFCGSSQYAGLEYGRECYCSPYLNSFSKKLPDANCTKPCANDPTQICGGDLTLTLYIHKNNTGGAGGRAGSGGLGGYGLGMGMAIGLGVAMGVIV